LGDPALTEAEAKELETVFKALADRHRVKILVTREKRGAFAYFAIEPSAFERIRDVLAVHVPAVAA
jgi:hypothetical protein